jgi:N-dimethylarginine dimethylaminohydrolase
VRVTAAAATFGAQSMVAPLRRVLLKHARTAYRSASHVAASWPALGYRECPRFDLAVRQYDEFLEQLGREVAAIEFLDDHAGASLDSIYAYDSVIVTSHGAVLCRMGKLQRRAEPEATGDYLEAAGIPTLGRIEAPGTLEAGDVVWLDAHTLAVGRGYRTNDEGIRQLRRLLEPFVSELVVVPLPHWGGPGACLHLMSLVSLVDHDLALTYSRALPVFAREWLLDRGYRLLDVPDEEHPTLGCNVLALAPRRCLMVAGNPVTRRLLTEAGATVLEYEGSEISLKGSGGPTCLTRPLLRA